MFNVRASADMQHCHLFSKSIQATCTKNHLDPADSSQSTSSGYQIDHESAATCLCGAIMFSAESKSLRKVALVAKERDDSSTCYN